MEDKCSVRRWKISAGIYGRSEGRCGRYARRFKMCHISCPPSPSPSVVTDIVPIAYEYRCSQFDEAMRTIKLIDFEDLTGKLDWDNI
jgi:hypothetical protein